MKFKGAIFDFDGTLVESMGIWEKIDREYLNGKGVEVPHGFGKTISLMTFYQVAEYAVKIFGFKENAQNVYEEWLEVAMRMYDKEVCVKENVEEGLAFLYERGVKMAIASASERIIIEEYLKSHQLEKYFDVIVTTGEAKAGKDSPEIYKSAAHKLGLKPCECAVFEDILLGVRSAAQAGFLTVGVYDKYSESEHILMQNEADWFIMNFGEIKEWFS